MPGEWRPAPGHVRVRRAVAALALAAAALAVVLPIARHGTPVGHDSRLHMLWVGQFADSLAAGVLYPRWLPDVNQGLGNPTFVFYPPLLYYLAALGRVVTGSDARGLDLASAALLLLSGVAAYRYLRLGVGRVAAWLGAVAVMALPYRVLDLYERFAVAEAAAFAWPPLALLGLVAVARAASLRAAGPPAAGVAAATTALAFTHLPTLVLAGPLLALAAVWHARRTGPTAGDLVPWPLAARRAAGGWLALALGLAAAAVFLLPAFWERALVQTEWLDWVARAPEHTIYSTRMAHGSQMMAFNHKVGDLVSWTAALAGAAALACLWPGGDTAEADSPAERGRLPILAAVVVAGASYALMTGPSAPLWTHLPLLPSVQFPWRLGVVLTLAAALLVAGAATRLGRPAAGTGARLLGALTVALLAFCLWLSADRIVENAYLGTPWAQAIADKFEADDAAEYRPRGAPAAGIPTYPRARVHPGGRASVRRWAPTHRVVDVDAPAQARLEVGTFLYPGWRATLDGRPLPLAPGPDGIISAIVPPGAHRVELRFGSTPVRTLGALLSLAATAVAAAWLVWGWSVWRGDTKKVARRHEPEGPAAAHPGSASAPAASPASLQP
jgi:hypothetical protein